MLNQKGQAFSVFELMIAGVVAFAILIILLMVIGGVGTTTNSDARTAISNSVKTASPSGQANTQNFSLKKDESLDVFDLASKTDLDAGSMFFLMGQFKSADAIDTGDGTFVKYTGTTSKKLAAKIICKQTAAALDTALGNLNSSGSSTTYDVGSGAAVTHCGDNTPCCAIVLIRSTT